MVTPPLKSKLVGVLLPGASWVMVWLLAMEALAAIIQEGREEPWKDDAWVEGDPTNLVPARILATLRRAAKLGAPATLDAEMETLGEASDDVMKLIGYTLDDADRRYIEWAVQRFAPSRRE